MSSAWSTRGRSTWRGSQSEQIVSLEGSLFAVYDCTDAPADRREGSTPRPTLEMHFTAASVSRGRIFSIYIIPLVLGQLYHPLQTGTHKGAVSGCGGDA